MRRAVPDPPSATRAESHGPRSVEADSRNGFGEFSDAVVGEVGQSVPEAPPTGEVLVRVPSSASEALYQPSARRRSIAGPEDYGIPLPEWLAQCVRHVPPGDGDTCPTDTEALLAAAFDFSFQLHAGQFRASGEPYIIHPIAVANLLRDIGARPA